MLHIIGVILLCILCFCVGALLGGAYMGHKYCVKLVNIRRLSDKHLQIVGLYDLWMSLPRDAIENYLNDKKLHNIVIYGFSTLGCRLYYELKNSSINIPYVIDLAPKIKVEQVNLKNKVKQDENCVVDAVIVTAIFSFDAIKKNLEDNGYKNIMSLYEILYDIKNIYGNQ